jgi:hypothetical protein
MGDFDLLAKEKEIANVAFTGKEEGPKMPVGCYEHFVTDNDLRDLLNSTESKNTRKNTDWSLTTFNDWRTSRMSATGDQIPDILSSSAEELNFLLLKHDARTAMRTILKLFTCFALDF